MDQITAQQAAQIADRKNAASQMEDVYKSINILARQGMYQVYSDRLLFPNEVKELEQLGYKVEIPSIGKCHKITWDNSHANTFIAAWHTEVAGALICEPEETGERMPLSAGEAPNLPGDDQYALPEHLKYTE
jgi:hypothetical protein